MRFKPSQSGYCMKLSARETYDWAHNTGAGWPCSQLSGHRFTVDVDSNGLDEFTLNGRYPIADWPMLEELAACVGDHLPAEYRHLWPVCGPKQTQGLGPYEQGA